MSSLYTDKKKYRSFQWKFRVSFKQSCSLCSPPSSSMVQLVQPLVTKELLTIFNSLVLQSTVSSAWLSVHSFDRLHGRWHWLFIWGYLNWNSQVLISEPVSFCLLIQLKYKKTAKYISFRLISFFNAVL